MHNLKTTDSSSNSKMEVCDVLEGSSLIGNQFVALPCP